jgi:hypothetical protein
VGGDTARTLLHNALEQYGDPKAAVYKHKDYARTSGVVTSLLGIVVQGIKRHGNRKDIHLLKLLEHNLSHFNLLNFYPNHLTEIRTLSVSIATAIKAIQLRNE